MSMDSYTCFHSCVLVTCKLGGIIFIMSFMSNCWPFLVNMAPPHIGGTQCVCPWLGDVLPSIICLKASSFTSCCFSIDLKWFKHGLELVLVMITIDYLEGMDSTTILNNWPTLHDNRKHLVAIQWPWHEKHSKSLDGNWNRFNHLLLPTPILWQLYILWWPS